MPDTDGFELARRVAEEAHPDGLHRVPASVGQLQATTSTGSGGIGNAFSLTKPVLRPTSARLLAAAVGHADAATKERRGAGRAGRLGCPRPGAVRSASSWSTTTRSTRRSASRSSEAGARGRRRLQRDGGARRCSRPPASTSSSWTSTCRTWTASKRPGGSASARKGPDGTRRSSP